MPDKNTVFAQEVARMLPMILRKSIKSQAPMLNDLNVTLPQVILLDLLREKGHCNMGELASGLEMSMGAVTGIVDKMTKQGFVKRERSSEDRRVVNVVPLEKGKKALDSIGKTRIRAVTDMFALLDDGEKKEYVRILRKIYEGIIG